MSSPKKGGRGAAAANWPFVLGLALIVLSIVLNLYLQDRSRAALKALPGPLGAAYEKSGKLGVTMVIASSGVLVMLWGWVMQSFDQARGRRAGGEGEPEPLILPDPDAGGVGLDTARYVGGPARHPPASDDPGPVGDGAAEPALAAGEDYRSLPVQRLSD